MKYLYINGNREYQTSVDEFDPVFPNVPITERYTAEFLSRCVTRTDEEAALLHTGMIYDKDTYTFSEPPEPEEPSEKTELPVEEGNT